MQQQIQEMKAEVLVRLTSQLNTTLAEFATLRYASREKSDDTPIARIGTPPLLQCLNQAGALPARAREYKLRPERYKNEFPDDQALRMIPPLIIESKIGMPAFLMPTTNAEDPAPTPPLVSA